MKELRLRDISSVDAANAFASEFMADFNARFARTAHNLFDAHRPLLPDESLDDVVPPPAQEMCLEVDGPAGELNDCAVGCTRHSSSRVPLAVGTPFSAFTRYANRRTLKREVFTTRMTP